MKTYFKLLFLMLVLLSVTSCDKITKLTSIDDTAIDTVTVVTVDERVDFFVQEKATNDMLQTYYALPVATYKLILERIGATATMNEIVAEYTRNQAYWIGIEISSKLKDINIESPGNVESITVTPNMKEETVKIVPPNATPESK